MQDLITARDRVVPAVIGRQVGDHTCQQVGGIDDAGHRIAKRSFPRQAHRRAHPIALLQQLDNAPPAMKPVPPVTNTVSVMRILWSELAEIVSTFWLYRKRRTRLLGALCVCWASSLGAQ